MDWTEVGAFLAVCAALAALALLGISLVRGRRDARRFQVLEEIARVSDGAEDLSETVEAICGVLVPNVADFCMIDVVSAGRMKRIATRTSTKGGPEAERKLAHRRPSTPEEMHPGAKGDELEPRFFERMSEADLRGIAHGEEDLDFLRGLGVRSVITAALRARGRLIGTVTLGTAWSRRRYRAHDARFARVLPGRLALALDNAGLFADLERAQSERAEIAVTLQHGLMPPPLPRIPGWHAATMYRPAGAENEIGGDFYDAFPITGGWMLVIGDVTGRGAQAASVTAQARYTLRAAALLSGDPLVALATLNSVLLTRRDSALCSVVAIALAADAKEPVGLAVAGHLPPLLIDGDAVTEAAESGPVLGAFGDADWTLERMPIDPGQQLVAVTDGVTEAGGSAERFGEERLRAELAGSASPDSAVRRLESALDVFTAGRLDDDAAALAVTPVGEAAAA